MGFSSKSALIKAVIHSWQGMVTSPGKPLITGGSVSNTFVTVTEALPGHPVLPST